MHLIISSFSNIDNDRNIFKRLNIKYKFLTFEDLLKKINKKYLKESKILIVIKNICTKLEEIEQAITNYDKQIEYYIFNIQTFYLNNSSLFFFNEFINAKFKINHLQNYFLIKNDTFIFPPIFNNKKIDKNIIITGVCQNISEYIFNTIHKFLYLSIYFKNIKIIIYENDSTDNTLLELKKYESSINNNNHINNIEIIILSQNNIKGKLTQRVSHARNYILKYIEVKKFNPDYVISIDMDDILIDFKCNSILYPFFEKINWSMFGANSNIYYDMWALRTLKNPNKDFWVGKKKDNKYIMSKSDILKEYFIIDKDSNPIKVNSCFNGIGIYKYKDIQNCRYNGNNTCEHVSFHQEMIKKHKANLYIYPKLIVGPHKILGKPMEFYKIEKLVKNNL